MKRVFFAIPIKNTDDNNLLERAVQPIAKDWGDQLRWVPNINWHITIRFLGNVGDDAIEYLLEAGEKASHKINKFLIKIISIEGFPSLDSQRIAAHVASCKELEQLFQRLSLAAMNVGLPNETRAFLPHITLAKFVSEIHPSFSPISSEKLTLHAQELVLFHSKQTGQGSEYIPLKTFRFNES